jgi:hypothetical protein
MLRFIEDAHNLPTLTWQDAFAHDLSGAFDFSQQPSAPLTLQQRQCP